MRCRRAFLNSSPDKTEETRNHEIADPEDIKLLEDLEELALRQFDKLVEEGSIFFEPSKPETLKHHGFQVSPSHKQSAALHLRHYLVRIQGPAIP